MPSSSRRPSVRRTPPGEEYGFSSGSHCCCPSGGKGRSLKPYGGLSNAIALTPARARSGAICTHPQRSAPGAEVGVVAIYTYAAKAKLTPKVTVQHHNDWGLLDTCVCHQVDSSGLAPACRCPSHAPNTAGTDILVVNSDPSH
eukprot:scaffold978_cov392-Prasinococcus_capsulatus_cf.AAC.14